MFRRMFDTADHDNQVGPVLISVVVSVVVAVLGIVFVL